MSGEVYAAAKASTCCDAVGEESPKGRRGGIKITLETNSIFGACLSTTPPSEDKGADKVLRQIAPSVI